MPDSYELHLRQIERAKMEEQKTKPSDQSVVRRPICLCAICGTDVFVGDDLVENKIYKSGELSYISLWHRRCDLNG